MTRIIRLCTIAALLIFAHQIRAQEAEPPYFTSFTVTPSSGLTAPATVTLAATAVQVGGTITKIVFFNGATQLNADFTSPYSYAWSGIGAGTYTVHAQVFGSSGYNDVSQDITFTVAGSNQAPTVTSFTVTPNTGLTAPQNVTLNASASDPDGTVASLQFYNGATPLGSPISGAGPYSYPLNGLAAGTYTLKAIATDNLGTPSAAFTQTITVSAATNQAPVVNPFTVNPSSGLTAPANVTLNASASDPDGSVASLQFYNGATALGSPISGPGPYSYALNGLAGGAYTLKAIATDNLGKPSATATFNISVNNPPSVSISANPNTGLISPASTTLTATASDSDGTVSTVQFYNGTTPLGSPITSPPYTYTVSGLTGGAYTFKATATDNLGATATSTTILSVATCNTTPCDRDKSSFQKLASDLQINGTTAQTVLTRTFSLVQSATIVASADGRYFPVDAPAGQVWITVDGAVVSSYPVTDWGSSTKAVQHSFNSQGIATLAPGSHTVSMLASAHPSRPGRFKIGSGSTLSILVHPKSQIFQQALGGESAQISLTTYNPGAGIDTVEGGANRPSVSILSHTITNPLGTSSNVVSLISGRSFQSCTGYGDALWGIWSDGVCQSTANASWSVNDIDPGAETQGAMYAHSIYPLNAGQSRTISFRASELAFGSDQAQSPSGAHENQVCYKVGSANLISAVGGQVMGSASGGANSFCSTYTFKCVATTQGSAGCPAAGTDVAIGTATVNIPSGHDGIVFFSAKTRIQAGNADSAMSATLGIKVDGVAVGATGVQQLAQGAGQASRTLDSAYVSAPGPNSTVLSPGNHTVTVYINVSGTNLQFPSVVQDVVLTYFD